MSCKMNMRRMTILLKQIERNSNVDVVDKYFKIVEDLANKFLVIDGECNLANIELLDDCGFEVYAVERDSFGWLVGGIETSKGVIMFG
jgi:hypothetical protein